MSKHTPGPWRVEAVDAEGTLVYHRVMSAGYRVAGVYTIRGGRGLSREESDANAHLIAAAPEMLAALEGILNIGHTPDTWEVAHRIGRAAIAKAKGET
jgi:hypothetical protein